MPTTIQQENQIFFKNSLKLSYLKLNRLTKIFYLKKPKKIFIA